MNRFMVSFLSVTILLLFSSCYSKNKMNQVYGEMYTLEEKGEYQQALKLLDSVPHSNRDWNYYLNYGLCVRNQDTEFWSGVSAKYFLKAYNLNPDNFETAYFFAQTNRYMGIDNAAYDLFLKAENLPGGYNYFSLYYELSDVCLKLGKNDEALSFIQKALDIKSTSYLIMMKGIALTRKGADDYLDEYFDMANSLDDDKILMTHLYAKENALQKKYDKALTVYGDLMKYNPDCSAYYSEVAKIYLIQKKYELAYEYLKKAYKLNWNDKECLKNLSLYFYTQGKLQECLNNANAYFKINTIINIDVKTEDEYIARFKDDIQELSL